MSFLLARTFNSLSISRGNRRDMDLTGASTPGSNSISIRFCFEKSKLSVVSCVLQNSRSSASRSILPPRLTFFFMKRPLLLAHGPSAYDPKPFCANSKNHRQEPAAIRLSQRCIAHFRRPLYTATYDQRFVEEDLLCLTIRNSMFLFVLTGVPVVPLESLDVAQ